jgi:glycerophosphoryl diester phosphodiesterase
MRNQAEALKYEPPIIIAHRGASGYLPEHTLEGYRLAVDLGADYIEPDLVFTKDGHLIARHDRYLSTTTDVADRPEFADRKTEKEGHSGADWFADDFTLAEIKTLFARQAFPGRSTKTDDRFHIPTFKEVINVALQSTASTGRVIGIYPETKAPGYHKAQGFDYAAAVMADLAAAGLDQPGSPVFIQSFETPILEELRPKTELPLIYLLAEADNLDFAGAAQFANGLGPNKSLLVKDGKSSGFMEKAHAAGLKVHPWTFRADQLSGDFRNPQAEYDFFFDLGIDGMFTDFTDVAFAARAAWLLSKE